MVALVAAAFVLRDRWASTLCAAPVSRCMDSRAPLGIRALRLPREGVWHSRAFGAAAVLGNDVMLCGGVGAEGIAWSPSQSTRVHLGTLRATSVDVAGFPLGPSGVAAGVTRLACALHTPTGRAVLLGNSADAKTMQRVMRDVSAEALSALGASVVGSSIDVHALSDNGKTWHGVNLISVDPVEPPARIGLASVLHATKRVWWFGGLGASGVLDDFGYVSGIAQVDGGWQGKIKAFNDKYSPGFTVAGTWPPPRAFAHLLALPVTTTFLLYGGVSNSGSLHSDMHIVTVRARAITWTTVALSGPGVRSLGRFGACVAMHSDRNAEDTNGNKGGDAEVEPLSEWRGRSVLILGGRTRIEPDAAPASVRQRGGGARLAALSDTAVPLTVTLSSDGRAAHVVEHAPTDCEWGGDAADAGLTDGTAAEPALAARVGQHIVPLSRSAIGAPITDAVVRAWLGASGSGASVAGAHKRPRVQLDEDAVLGLLRDASSAFLVYGGVEVSRGTTEVDPRGGPRAAPVLILVAAASSLPRHASETASVPAVPAGARRVAAIRPLAAADTAAAAEAGERHSAASRDLHPPASAASLPQQKATMSAAEQPNSTSNLNHVSRAAVAAAAGDVIPISSALKLAELLAGVGGVSGGSDMLQRLLAAQPSDATALSAIRSVVATGDASRAQTATAAAAAVSHLQREVETLVHLVSSSGAARDEAVRDAASRGMSRTADAERAVLTALREVRDEVAGRAAATISSERSAHDAAVSASNALTTEVRALRSALEGELRKRTEEADALAKKCGQLSVEAAALRARISAHEEAESAARRRAEEALARALTAEATVAAREAVAAADRGRLKELEDAVALAREESRRDRERADTLAARLRAVAAAASGDGAMAGQRSQR